MLQEWARNQLEASSLRAINQLGSEYSQQALADARSSASWGCPKCRQLYTRAALPAGYTCFCGKETDPEWDPWLAPHTCGQLCEK
jgi:NF-X1-type zinc finger protein NFXL1